MWDLPDPGIEPVSPALAGGFFTIEPLGKPPPVQSFCGGSGSYVVEIVKFCLSDLSLLTSFFFFPFACLSFSLSLFFSFLDRTSDFSFLTRDPTIPTSL